ncbi:MAG: type II secretion system protein J [Syntrophobacteraceae bacterium]
MKRWRSSFRICSKRGFTLLEVMVALALGAIIVGGVMGLLSVTLQYTQRLQEKSRLQPVLDAAAQEIFANPEKALEEGLDMAAFPNSPSVQVFAVRETGNDESFGKHSKGRLYRVLLKCHGQILEFSIIIPESATE